MTRLIVNGPPPPEGGIWCPLCVATWKKALIEAHGLGTAAAFAKWAEEKLGGPDSGPPVVLAVPPHIKMPPLHQPVTRSLVPALRTVLDVCWTHVPAEPFENEEPEVRRPPGLIAGMS